MKHNIGPHKNPEPPKDPKQLIEYVECFYSMVQASPGFTTAWSLGIRNIRVDIEAIEDERIRVEALEIYRAIQSGDSVLRHNPELKESIVLPPIKRLIDYLKSQLHL